MEEYYLKRFYSLFFGLAVFLAAGSFGLGAEYFGIGFGNLRFGVGRSIFSKSGGGSDYRVRNKRPRGSGTVEKRKRSLAKCRLDG